MYCSDEKKLYKFNIFFLYLLKEIGNIEINFYFAIVQTSSTMSYVLILSLYVPAFIFFDRSTKRYITFLSLPNVHFHFRGSSNRRSRGSQGFIRSLENWRKASLGRPLSTNHQETSRRLESERTTGNGHCWADFGFNEAE